VNPAAYEEYLRGRREWSKREVEPLRLAIAHFERAIATDSSYAPAWAGLADAYVLMPLLMSEPARPLFATALGLVQNALRLDPHLAEAHTTLAMLKYRSEFDWAGADAEFDTALALNPSYATAHQWYGLSLALRGRFEEAEAEVARARELDPFSSVARFNQGQIWYWHRRFDDAITILGQVVGTNPRFYGGHWWLGSAYYAKRMYPEALAKLVIADSLDSGNLHRDQRVRAAVLAGDTRSFWTLAVADGEERARTKYVSPHALIVANAQFGDRDRAFHWIERGLEDRDFRMLTTLRDPMLDPLRSDARFATILRKCGLEP
jgi:tetratricopeptide (TPR) repeat protein